MNGPPKNCPCDSGKPYAQCCQPFHDGALPATAEQLMRSRYSAFVSLNEPYLLKTWHPETRPKRIDFDPDQRWLGLKIIETNDGSATDHTGTVKFAARYKLKGRGYRLEELSYFERCSGAWTYINGDVSSA